MSVLWHAKPWSPHLLSRMPVPTSQGWCEGERCRARGLVRSRHLSLLPAPCPFALSSALVRCYPDGLGAARSSWLSGQGQLHLGWGSGGRKGRRVQRACSGPSGSAATAPPRPPARHCAPRGPCPRPALSLVSCFPSSGSCLVLTPQPQRLSSLSKFPSCLCPPPARSHHL